jgi:hypothetical protein
MRKRWILALIVGVAITLFSRDLAWAESPETGTLPPAYEYFYICTPRNQLRHPRQCTSLGPGGELAKYAQRGIYLSQPLRAIPLENELSAVPFNYLSVARKNVVVYSSVRDALRSNNPKRTLGTGFIYVSWIDRFDQDGQIIYQIAPGEYIRGDNVARISTPKFTGLTFNETPDNGFGWVLNGGYSSIGPGWDKAHTNNYYYRFEVVQIYDKVKVGDFEWYMIRPGEWVEQRQISVVQPDTNPPEGVEDNRWISVNLYEQTIAAYEDGELVFATVVSSGLRGWWTRPGTFQVFRKLATDDMQGAFEADRSDFYYLEDVPWVLYYDEARAIHGTYWHNNYGWQQSHGCVNLAPTDAQWIYNWAEEGTWVYVWDPSGITPIETEAYGAGGV